VRQAVAHADWSRPLTRLNLIVIPVEAEIRPAVSIVCAGRWGIVGFVAGR
jgi:hypothetical protein